MKAQVDFEAFGREFQVKSTQFIDHVQSLSKNELVRVLKALTLYPLEHERIKFVSPQEKMAFDVGVEIFTAKVNMTVSYIGEQAAKGTEMINEAEGDTREEKVENAIINAKSKAEKEELKENVKAAQEEIIEEAPAIVKEVIKPKKKPVKKATKKAVKKVKKDEV